MAKAKSQLFRSDFTSTSWETQREEKVDLSLSLPKLESFQEQEEECVGGGDPEKPRRRRKKESKGISKGYLI